MYILPCASVFSTFLPVPFSTAADSSSVNRSSGALDFSIVFASCAFHSLDQPVTHKGKQDVKLRLSCATAFAATTDKAHREFAQCIITRMYGAVALWLVAADEGLLLGRDLTCSAARILMPARPLCLTGSAWGTLLKQLPAARRLGHWNVPNKVCCIASLFGQKFSTRPWHAATRFLTEIAFGTVRSYV